eukprot:gene30284-34179_t
MLDFPLASFVRFCHNHGLLQVSGRPQWRTVKGGSREYVRRMLDGIPQRRLNTAVRSVRRSPAGGALSVALCTDSGTELFDEVVLACHSDQALRLLGGEASATEREVLGAIRYQPNRAVLHTDASVEHVLGDVTDDDVLRAAGIASATAVIVALETDADTVYVTLSARAMRPDVTIVSRARTTGSTGKLELAGATRAVNPQRIGGRRLAVFALQPDVAEFLDVVMHDEDLDWRIEQVEAGPGIAGRTLAGLEIQQRTGALLLAIRRTARAQLEANPPGDLEVPEGAVLIALGTPSELAALAALVA